MLRRDLSRKPKIQSQIQNPGETPRQAKNKKLGVIWIGAPLIGTATGLGLANGMSECTAGGGPGCKVTSPLSSEQEEEFPPHLPSFRMFLPK